VKVKILNDEWYPVYDVFYPITYEGIEIPEADLQVIEFVFNVFHGLQDKLETAQKEKRWPGFKTELTPEVLRVLKTIS